MSCQCGHKPELHTKYGCTECPCQWVSLRYLDLPPTSEQTYPQAAPLPPTAEQTSIARFNALADELRKLGKELKATGDALADAMSHNFDDLQAEFSAKLDRIEGAVFDSHNSHKCDHESVMMVLGSFENRLIEHLSHASQVEIAIRESLDRMADQVRAILLEFGAARDRHEQINAKFERIQQSLAILNTGLEVTGNALASAMGHNFKDVSDKLHAIDHKLNGHTRNFDHLEGCINNSVAELNAKLEIILNSKKECLDAEMWECPDAEMCGCVTHCEHDHPKPRAIAKKKAAPLVGKKGTGRKG